MEITNQEKVNIAYIFISAYENILGLIKPFHLFFCESLTSDTYEEKATSILRTKFKDKKTLKMKDSQELLVELDLISQDDLNLLIELSKVRNDIGHESLQNYFNDDVGFDYFKLDKLFSLYKAMLKKLTKEFIIDNPDKIKDCLETYNINYSSLVFMVNDLLKDSKFNEVKKLLEDENEIQV